MNGCEKMKEQEVILKNVNSFEPKHIFECGQCFRWDKNIDDSYTGVVNKSVLNVKKIGNDIDKIFKKVTENDNLTLDELNKLT